MTHERDTAKAAGAEPDEATEDAATAAAEAARARKELQDLVYSVSHDLREPLRMVRSYVGLIERRLGEDLSPDIQEFMGFAVDGAKRMDEMLAGLLTFSRVETHGGPMVETSTEDAVQEAWEQLGEEAETTHATLVTDPLPDVRADHVQLERLFYELFANALRFRGKGDRPRIEVSAEEEDGHVRISVKDDGIGIDPEQAERCFAFFQRLHARSEYAEGVGMGLPIAKRIVQRHGGQIGIESVEGEGTTVWFTLPSA